MCIVFIKRLNSALVYLEPNIMSVASLDLDITPPEVKPQRGIDLALSVLRPLACVLGPSTFPLIVYLIEGQTNLFWCMLGFGSLVSLLFLIFDLQKINDVVKYMKTNCCVVIHRKKLLKVPSHYKYLPPLKLSSRAKKSPCPLQCEISDQLQPTTIVDVLAPSSTSVPDQLVEMGQQPTTPPKRRMISASSVSLSPLRNETTASTKTSPGPLQCQISDQPQPTTIVDVLAQSSTSVSQQLVEVGQQHTTPPKRRMISASSVSLSPLRDEMTASTKISPFSKRRLGFPGCISPRQLRNQDALRLSTILESRSPDCSVDHPPSGGHSCFSR